MNLEEKTDEREAIRRDPVRIDDRRLSTVNVRKPRADRRRDDGGGRRRRRAIGLVELAHRCSEAADTAVATVPSSRS